MIVQTLQAIWWLARNPQAILYGWAGIWLGLLYGSMASMGPMNAIQFAITGMFNLSSAFGLVPPMAAVGLMFVGQIQRWLLRAAIGVFRAIQRQILSGAKDAAKALAKAKNALSKAAKKAFPKPKGKGKGRLGVSRDNGYLGEAPEELSQALDELADALDMYQGVDFFE